MNKISSTISLGLAIGLLTNVSLSAADETVTTKTQTTTYTGVVSEVNPTASTIILKSATSPTPVTYSYTKETTFVDATGKTVTYEAIKNSPVTVEYSSEGGQIVARKVIQSGPAVVVSPPAAPAVVTPPPAAGMIREKTTTKTETTH